MSHDDDDEVLHGGAHYRGDAFHWSAAARPLCKIACIAMHRGGSALGGTSLLLDRENVHK